MANIHENQVAELQAQLTAMQEVVKGYKAEIDALKSERDEADRLAGAARRELEDEKKSSQTRASWLRKAKKEWGVDDRVSFDVVWNQALAIKKQLESIESSDHQNKYKI